MKVSEILKLSFRRCLKGESLKIIKETKNGCIALCESIDSILSQDLIAGNLLFRVFNRDGMLEIYVWRSGYEDEFL